MEMSVQLDAPAAISHENIFAAKVKAGEFI
jgi:hypothetical protein